MPSESHCRRCGEAYEQGYCPNGCRSLFAVGDRVMVSDEDAVHVADNWVLRKGARGTVVDFLDEFTPRVDFDGVPHIHGIPEYRLRPLDVIEMLAEVERGREPS